MWSAILLSSVFCGQCPSGVCQVRQAVERERVKIVRVERHDQPVRRVASRTRGLIRRIVQR